MADLQSVLDAEPVDKATKADAWDIYNSSKDADELADKLGKLGVSKETKAKLWDLKHSEGANKIDDSGSVAPESVGGAFLRQGKEMLSGVGDVLGGIPGAIKGIAEGAAPTTHVPLIGGQFIEEQGRNFLSKSQEAKQAASEGRYSDAARLVGEAIPVIGPQIGAMSQYGSTHTPFESVGAAGTMYALGKLTDVAKARLGSVPKPPASILGETPAVRTMLSVMKPGNAVHALDDYPMVMARLKAENPALGNNPANTIAETKEALDAAMTENRHYNEGHIGPIKAMNMQVDLSPVADAIEGTITERMKKNSPGIAKRLQSIADRYRDKNSISDLENMLHESNAQAAALRQLNPGEWAQVTNASDSKAVLDATNKAYRNTYYKALDNFNAGPAVKMLNREYGAMMGFRQDLEGVIQQALTSDIPTPATMGGKIGGVVKAVMHPGKTLAGAVVESLQPKFDVADTQMKLSQAFKSYRGEAPPLPVPPVRAPAGRKLLTSGSIKLPGVADTSGPIPPTVPQGFNLTNPGIQPNRQIGPAPVVTPPPQDLSGPMPNRPYPGAGISPNYRQIGSPTQVPQGGFATGTTNDLVPVKHPVTGQIEYVPAWMLQKYLKKGFTSK